MKKYIIACVVATLASVANSWAATNTFVVTQFKGTLTGTNGVTPITAAQISTNQLIMVISDDAHEVTISEVDGTSTNTLMNQFVAAFVGGGKFNTDLDGTFTPADTNNVPDYDGDLQFTGKLSPAPEKGAPKKVKATIIGVWTETPDTIFKGTLSGVAP
jgi:hypothetical protein